MYTWMEPWNGMNWLSSLYICIFCCLENTTANTKIWIPASSAVGRETPWTDPLVNLYMVNKQMTKELCLAQHVCSQTSSKKQFSHNNPWSVSLFYPSAFTVPCALRYLHQNKLARMCDVHATFIPKNCSPKLWHVLMNISCWKAPGWQLVFCLTLEITQ